MAERLARVLRVHADTLSLVTDEAPCQGCSIGCRGRCNLFAPDADGRFELDGVNPGGFRVGDRVRIELDDLALRWAAYRGYGLALLGLLVGAGLGYGLAAALFAAMPDSMAMNPGHDGPTLVGMLAGLFGALRLNRSWQVRPSVVRID